MVWLGAKLEAASEITGGTLRKYTEGPSVCQPKFDDHDRDHPQRRCSRGPSAPTRGGTTRRCSTAAREAFAEGGESTALEEIARRAGVGIGTLYRHFPNRQALLEALYVNEVEEVCRSAAELDDGDPWEALNSWFERSDRYLATKRALAHELLDYLDQDAALFQICRASLFAAGEPLLERAQEAGAVRPDVEFPEVMQMVMGIAKIPASDPARSSTSSGSRSTVCGTARRARQATQRGVGSGHRGPIARA